MKCFSLTGLSSLLLFLVGFILFEIVHFSNSLTVYIIVAILSLIYFFILKKFFFDLKIQQDREFELERIKRAKQLKKVEPIKKRMSFYASHLDKYSDRFIYLFNNRAKRTLYNSMYCKSSVYSYFLVDLLENIDFKEFVVTVQTKAGEIKIIDSVVIINENNKHFLRYKYIYVDTKYKHLVPEKIISIEHRL